MRARILCIAIFAVACGSSVSRGVDGGPSDSGFDAGPSDAGFDAGPSDAGPTDSGFDAGFDAGADAGEFDGGCFLTYDGVWGACISTSACAALGDDVSTPGYCPGAADIQCCTDAPDVADNPPVPAGWQLMPQADVTQPMTDWAVTILHDGVDYPMYASTEQTFGTQLVMARVEWHPPDFQNNAIHRGVTLYEPIPDAG